MEEREIALFRSDLLKSHELIEHIHDNILGRRSTFRDRMENLDSMAYQLHNLYGAHEKLFEIVAGFFENQVGGARYHTDLLRRMGTRIKGIRPALISRSTCEMLAELRRFRHFFRHAYTAKLDPDRIDRIVQIAIRLKDSFRQDMESFLAQLG